VESTGKKPGFPLQVLGFAHANPVGFPLQSLARAARYALHTYLSPPPAAATMRIANPYYVIIQPVLS
jgi:hypothetical protein